MALDEVRYAQVWEDHRTLEQALRVGPEDDVLSITSGGDNVLALLLAEPRTLTAVDMSPAQSALFELKRAGIRGLSHPDFVVLVGASGDAAGARLRLYARVRQELPEAARRFWDAREGLVAAGVIHSGRLERYFRVFREEHLPCVWKPGLADRLLRARSLEEQARTFEAEAASPALEALLASYFGLDGMASHGRHPAQLRYVRERDFGRYFMARLRHVCTRQRLRGNPYFESLFTGGYRDLRSAPPYLRPSAFGRLKGLVGRVRVVTAELRSFLEACPEGEFSKANLSDVFEYMSEAQTQDTLDRLASRLRPGGRLAYWNLFVPRHRPPALSGRLRRRTALAGTLFWRDRSMFYRSFEVEEVLRAGRG